MTLRYRLADHVTSTLTPDGGSVLTDVARDRVYVLNPTAAAFLATLVAGPGGPMPNIVERIARQDYAQAVTWAEHLRATLVRGHLIQEADV
jgi:hypothetical protein